MLQQNFEPTLLQEQAKQKISEIINESKSKYGIEFSLDNYLQREFDVHYNKVAKACKIYSSDVEISKAAGILSDKLTPYLWKSLVFNVLSPLWSGYAVDLWNSWKTQIRDCVLEAFNSKKLHTHTWVLEDVKLFLDKETDMDPYSNFFKEFCFTENPFSVSFEPAKSDQDYTNLTTCLQGLKVI